VKKHFLLLVALCLAVPIFGCGGSQQKGKNKDKDKPKPAAMVVDFKLPVYV
jgi:hypothetical protein